MMNRVFSEEWEDINLLHIYLFQTHLVPLLQLRITKIFYTNHTISLIEFILSSETTNPQSKPIIKKAHVKSIPNLSLPLLRSPSWGSINKKISDTKLKISRYISMDRASD